MNPNPSQLNPFDFKLIDKFPGYNSATDKTKLARGFLIRGSKNVYKKISGTIATRPGLKRRGTADSTDAGVKSDITWNTSVGTTRPVRVTSNNKMEVESDIVTSNTLVWYQLYDTGGTDSPAKTKTRFVFDTWWDNDDKSDRLVMVNGETKIRSWSGGMAKIASATATTITKSGDETWAEVGFALTLSAEKKFFIGTTEYTYTGGEGTTELTGVTPDPSAVAVDSVAIQSVMVASDKPIASYKADFCKTIGNQLWVGSYSSRIIFISCDVSAGGTLGFLLYTNSVGLVVGDPDAVILDSPAKGIGVSNGKVLIFSGTNDLVVVTPNFDLPVSQAAIPVTGGTARNVLQKIEKKQLAGLTSALGHEFIDSLGEHLIWLDQKNRLRAVGPFPNINTLKPVTLSLDVQNELSEDDFTDGHVKVISDNDGDTVYITAPNNGRDWMYQIREVVDENGNVVTERLWQPPQVRGITRFTIIDGVTYGYSNVNPQIYQVWDTNQWFDDSPTDEPIPYTCVARFAYEHRPGGLRSELITFNTIYFEGYLVPGLELTANLYLDYQGTMAKKAVTINSIDSQATFYMGASASSLGDSSLGDNPLGDGILEESNEQELLPKFRAITDVTLSNFFEYSIEVYSYDADSRWELLCLGTNVEKAIQDPKHIRK